MQDFPFIIGLFKMNNTEKNVCHDSPQKPADLKITITLERHLVPRFYQLLGKGVSIEIKTGCSIKELLCHRLGLTTDYIEKRILTIFLNGRPVDDIDSPLIANGSTIALSGAMPGLAGATLRRGSRYASLRSNISHDKTIQSVSRQNGRAVLKFFNLIVRDLGPRFLKIGVWVREKELSDFFKNQADDFWTGCRTIEINGALCDLNDLKEFNWENRKVFFRVYPG